MTILKTALVKGAIMAAVAGSAIAAASTASADVVCNRWGECWHVHDRMAYPPNIGFSYHNDAWGDHHRYGHWRWRQDRFDRGYYRNGVWITF